MRRRQGLPQRQGRLHWFHGLVNQQSGTGREVPTDHEAPGQEMHRCKRSRRRATSNSREEIGLASQADSTAEQGQGVRTQWLGSSCEQGLTEREWCPQGSGTSASHGTVQAWTQMKNSQGRDPRTHERKEAQPTAGKRAYPTAGRQETIHTRSADEKGSEVTASNRAQCIRCQTHYSRQDRGDGEHSKTQKRRNAKLPSSRNSPCGDPDKRHLSESR